VSSPPEYAKTILMSLPVYPLEGVCISIHNFRLDTPGPSLVCF